MIKKYKMRYHIMFQKCYTLIPVDKVRIFGRIDTNDCIVSMRELCDKCFREVLKDERNNNSDNRND